MRIRTDEEVLKECNELGEAAVKAGIATGLFSDNETAAIQWLMQRSQESEHQRHQQEMRYTRWALYASWVLVGITFLGIWWQKVDNREQREQAKEQLENANNLSRAVFGGFMVTPQPVLGRIAVDLSNSGRAAAIVSELTVDLTIKKITDDSIIQHEHREWNGPILISGPISKWFEINGTWPDDPARREQAIWQKLWGDVITASVQIQYDSGFGKIERQTFCQTLVADERINGPGKRLGLTNQSCEDAPAFILARRRQLGLAAH